MCGSGTITTPSYTYTGDVRDGLPHGTGRWVDRTGGEVYQGSWEAGERREGRLTSGGGEVLYEGAWQGGVPGGQGTLVMTGK